MLLGVGTPSSLTGQIAANRGATFTSTSFGGLKRALAKQRTGIVPVPVSNAGCSERDEIKRMAEIFRGFKWVASHPIAFSNSGGPSYERPQS